MTGVQNIITTFLGMFCYVVMSFIVFVGSVHFHKLAKPSRVLIFTIGWIFSVAVFYFVLCYLFFYHFPYLYTGPCNAADGIWRSEIRLIDKEGVVKIGPSSTIACNSVTDVFTSGVKEPSIIRDPDKNDTFIFLMTVLGSKTGFSNNRIALAEFSAKGLKYKGVVLSSQKNSLSNPSLFRGKGGEIFVLPDVEGKAYHPLYERTEESPMKWRYRKNLNLPWTRPLISTSVVLRDDRYWFFGSDAQKPYQLYIAYTSDLLGEWKELVASPYIQEKDSYPVSGIIEYQGSMFRIIRGKIGAGLYSYKPLIIPKLEETGYQQMSTIFLTNFNMFPELTKSIVNRIDVVDSDVEEDSIFISMDKKVRGDSSKGNRFIFSIIMGSTVFIALYLVLLPTFTFLHSSLFTYESFWCYCASPHIPTALGALPTFHTLPVPIAAILNSLLHGEVPMSDK